MAESKVKDVSVASWCRLWPASATDRGEIVKSDQVGLTTLIMRNSCGRSACAETREAGGGHASATDHGQNHRCDQLAGCFQRLLG